MLWYLLLNIALLAILMAYITPVKYSAKKSILIIVFAHCVSWIGNYLIYVYLGADFLSHTFAITAAIPGFICFNIVAKYKGLRVLFSLLTVTLFALLASFIGNLADVYYNNVLLQIGLKALSFILVIVFMVAVFRKPYLKLLQTLEKGWGPLCLIPALLNILICLLEYVPTHIENRPENIPIILFTFALAFVFYVIFYINFGNISQFFEMRRNRELLAVQTDLYKKEYLALQDNINQSKIYRHDMKHHLNAVNAFLNDGNLQEAQEYICTLDGNLSRLVTQTYCENYVVNVILSSYIHQAKQEGIEVACDLNIPENVTIDPIELGLIFANAMENAINACRQIKDRPQRTIIVACKMQKGQMYIRISNPVAGEVRFEGEYPASGSEGHGIGTRSIAAIAQKYGGVFSFAVQDGIFKTTVTLQV